MTDLDDLLAPDQADRLSALRTRPRGHQGGAGTAARRRFAGPLTRREREVLLRIAEGETNAEIARELWLAPATVKSHVRHILERLGARSRAHAVWLARDVLDYERARDDRRPDVRSDG